MNNKKTGLIILISLIIILIFLVGKFIYDKLNTTEFYAKVVESYETYSIINPLESEDIFKSYPVLQIDKGSLNAGDLIKVKIEPKIIETYPPLARVKEYEFIKTRYRK